MQKLILVLFCSISLISFAQVSFQDNATTVGVGYSYGASTLGGGISFCDFNNDGWDDLTYATTNGTNLYFFVNNNGTFSQVDLGIDNTNRVKQVLWVDYDNDGDKDFVATSITGVNKFYRNNGNLTFTDISGSIGFFTENLYTYGISFGDIDADGDLDAFICNRDETTFNQPNYLYRNDEGIFVDITASAGINMANELSFCAAFFDYDNDGDQDIYVANDKTIYKNRLYQNDGIGNFTDVSDASGTGIYINAMSTTIDDFDNDGWLDIYVSNTSEGNYHLRNNGDGTFSNVASTVGTSFNSIGWSCVFLDADNDTDLDLYVSSSVNSMSAGLTSAFYENNGANIYSIPAAAGFENDLRISFSNAIGDFNNDGLPDISVMNDTENNFLWENVTNTNYAWLKVKLEGVQSNKDGIGSKIEISINDNKQYRYTLCGEGYLGQNSGTEIFGLGNTTVVDYVKVIWPSGVEDMFYNITANQTLSIIEGSSLSVEGYDSEAQITIYPNPSKGLVYVSNIKTNTTLIISNIMGETLKEMFVSPETNSIDCTSFSQGIYLMTFKNKNSTVTYKMVKH